jgi:hypothetical protein
LDCCTCKKGAELVADGIHLLQFFLETRYKPDTYTRMSTHSYKYIRAHLISMSTSEKLSRFDLKIHEVGHEKCFAVDEDVVFY